MHVHEALDMNRHPRSTDAPEAHPRTLVQQEDDFTAEGAPAPGPEAPAVAPATNDNVAPALPAPVVGTAG
jgi:hypothetical protein